MKKRVLSLAIPLFATLGSTAIASDSSNESPFLRNARALTYEGKRSGEAYFSPDGKHLVFQSERESDNPFYQIYMLAFDTGEVHRVSPGLGKTTCSFFQPESDRVLYASTHLDPNAADKQRAELDFRASGKSRRYSWDYDEHFDIFSAKRSGKEIRRLTDRPGYDAEGGYSPRGDKIVFCSLRDAYPIEKLSEDDQKRIEIDAAYFGEIYIMNADGTEPTRLTHWPGYDGGPFFSPDGGRIVWRHFSEDGMTANIYSMRIDGSDRRQLTDFESMCWAPYYHPSGEYVIFTTNKHGFENFELYLVDTSGGHAPVRVTQADGFDGLPVFSPDGSKIVWTSNRTSSGASQLFIAEWDHSAARQALADAPGRGGDTEASYNAGRTAENLRRDVTFLASDDLEGRMTGSKGTQKAADYIAQRLEGLGFEPLGDKETFFQEFPFTSGIEVVAKKNRLKVSAKSGDSLFKLDEDFRPLAFTSNESVSGDVVFVGYGLTVPGKLGEGYDSYAGIDVKDKIVVALRYAPEEVDTERRQELNRYAGLRYKAMLARDRGAKALLVVTGPNSPNAGKLVPIKFDQSLASSGIAVASISGEVAESIFANTGHSLRDVQTELDLENPHFEGAFAIENVTVDLSATVIRKKKSGRNVVGVLHPTKKDGKKSEYLLIGAHYDHIGYGEIGSLAHKGEEGLIHNGADDNASGTSMILELAAALADRREKDDFGRGVVVGFWSGEELGLIGSSFFVANPPLSAKTVVAYMNFDMVGRLRDNKLILQGVGSSAVWKSLIEKRNVLAGFDLVIQEDPYLPTDVTAFYPKGIPVLSFFTGSHDNYNRPTDDATTLNYEGMERIERFAERIAVDVLASSERPDYVEVQRTKAESGQRASLRAYLGTIPDYATDGVEGVKLSGVRSGGPADKAGFLGGDVIVEFGGQKIANIYDYTYALEAARIGRAIDVVVVRDRQRVTLSVVPEARK